MRMDLRTRLELPSCAFGACGGEGFEGFRRQPADSRRRIAEADVVERARRPRILRIAVKIAAQLKHDAQVFAHIGLGHDPVRLRPLGAIAHKIRQVSLAELRALIRRALAQPGDGSLLKFLGGDRFKNFELFFTKIKHA